MVHVIITGHDIRIGILQRTPALGLESRLRDGPGRKAVNAPSFFMLRLLSAKKGASPHILTRRPGDF